MGTADEIRSLRDRVMAELNLAHDYYTDTKTAWRIVHRVVGSGYAGTSRNRATGTVTTLAEIAAKSRGYVAEQLIEATFQQFISVLETFVFDILRIWLMTYPASFSSNKKVDFADVLNAPDRDAIIRLVVYNEVKDLFYKKPKDWFEFLESKVKLGCPLAGEIDQFAEAKASRDVLVHGRGIAKGSRKNKLNN